MKGIVDDTFETCDTSRNGKLEIDEFVKWVHKNPKLVDNIFVIQCHTPSDHSGCFQVISTPDNALESERIVSQHDTPAVLQTDENAQGPSSLIDLFRDTDTPVKDIEGKSFVDSIGTSKSDESLAKLQFEVTGVQNLGAVDTDHVESEIYLTPQGSEVAPKKLGQEGRTTPDQIESLQFGGITLDAKPLGSTEALWHPLKEREMSESTESTETERLEEPGFLSVEDKEMHEVSIQIISDAFTTENKPNNTVTHPSTGVDIGTKVLSDNLMQQLKEVDVEFCMVASGIQNSEGV